MQTQLTRVSSWIRYLLRGFGDFGKTALQQLRPRLKLLSYSGKKGDKQNFSGTDTQRKGTTPLSTF
jgi:hypothetical protein